MAADEVAIAALAGAGWRVIRRGRGDALVFELVVERGAVIGWATVAPPQADVAATRAALALAVSGVAPLEAVLGGPEASVVIERVPEGASWLDRADDPVLARRVGCEVARTLARLHQRGLHAGGVRPERVIIGEGGEIVLAPRAEPFVASARAVSVGIAPLYDESYLAPERLRGLPSSAAADVFALAASVVRVLDGVHPFPGTGVVQLRAILAGAPRALTSSPALRAALDADPARRPSAAQLAEELSS